MVSQLSADALQQLVVELLRRQPAVLADLINGEMAVYRENVVTLLPVSDAQPPDEVQQAPVDAQPPPDNVEQQPADAEQQPADAHPPLLPMEAVQAEIRPPDWCYCGLCRPMPTQLENKCCCMRKMDCISTTALFRNLVLDGNVLDLAMRYREDVLALDHARNNENFRHTAYRQYVLWQHGRLGQGNRRVVPSCCVIAIRRRYPSASGIYTGFRPTRL